MRRKYIVPLTAMAVVIPIVGFMTAQAQTTRDAERDPDRLAIDRLTRNMIQAFDDRNAAAIAACWTEDGEFIQNDGEPIRGRARIQEGYAEFFAALKGRPKLEIQSDGVRFPSKDMGVAEVTLRLKNDDGEVRASGRQTIVAVREAGLWKVAMIREWDRDVAADVGLEALEWLVGTWHAAMPDREATITYTWDENKAFIRGNFTVKEGAKIIQSGTETIGMDHSAGAIRSWVFQSDGGFGGGVWTGGGGKWSVDAHGVRADGSRLTATILYVRVDPDALTWQAVHQSVDGIPVADTAPIKVVKVK